MEASNSRIEQAKPQFAASSARMQLAKEIRGVVGIENGRVTIGGKLLDDHFIEAHRTFYAECHGGDVRPCGMAFIPICFGES